MKNLNFESIRELFDEYALSCNEMICIKGGDDTEPILLPNPPKVKI